MTRSSAEMDLDLEPVLSIICYFKVVLYSLNQTQNEGGSKNIKYIFCCLISRVIKCLLVRLFMGTMVKRLTLAQFYVTILLFLLRFAE